jgi:hypothetical protein
MAANPSGAHQARRAFAAIESSFISLAVVSILFIATRSQTQLRYLRLQPATRIIEAEQHLSNAGREWLQQSDRNFSEIAILLCDFRPIPNVSHPDLTYRPPPGLGADIGRLPSRGYRLAAHGGRGRLWGRAAICGRTGGAGRVGPLLKRNLIRLVPLDYSGLRGEGSIPVPLPPPISFHPN